MNDSFQNDPRPRGGVDDGEEAPSLPEFLLDPVGILTRRWVWMTLTVVLGFIASGAAAYLMQPVYIARSSILITQQQIPEEFVRSTVREDTISNMSAMAGEVLSQENLARLIRDLDVPEVAKGEKTVAELVGDFRSSIELSPRERASKGRRGETSVIYGIDFRSEDPEQAAVVANALAGLFAEASIERRSNQARRTTAFLKRQLERDEAELREQSQRASEFRRAHRGELPGELATNMRRLELLSERRQLLVTQIASKENRIVALEAVPTAVDKSESMVLLDELRRQLATESAVNTEEHPNVIALRERIRRLDEVVAAERSTGGPNQVAQAERREIALLERQMVEAQAAITELNERIDRTPAIGEELQAISQKEQVLRERYLASLRKVEDSQLAENLESAQQGAHVSLLDRANVPTSPERPRWLVAAVGVIASLGIALALALLLEIVDPVVVSMQQLERLAEGPCLGSLPYVA